MDYEKKYKELVGKIEKAYLYAQTDSTKAVLEEIRYEIKESEDEKIRTGLINGFKECLKNSQYPKNAQKYWHNIKIEDILAWLEKQGESDETKAKIFLINQGYPIDANGVFPTYEEIYNIIRDGLENQGEFNDNIITRDDEILQAISIGLTDVEKDLGWSDFGGLPIEEIQDWLEKQGEKETLCDKCRKEHPPHSCQDITELGRCTVEHEQNPTNKVGPKFKDGDWIVINY